MSNWIFSKIMTRQNFVLLKKIIVCLKLAKLEIKIIYSIKIMLNLNETQQNGKNKSKAY